MTFSLLNERAEKLLKLVVDRYIREGQPVGSKTLSEETSLGLSAATIRNVLGDLEEQGYLRSPHTSAGRIPTARGYRYFANTLLTASASEETTTTLSTSLNLTLDPSSLASTASNLLSELTQLAGLVTLPKREKILLKHIEFASLNENRILAILTLNNNEIQNRIIQTQRHYSSHELIEISHFLNTRFAGQDINHIHDKLVSHLKKEREQIDRLMQNTIEIAEKAFETSGVQTDYVVAGQSHLIDLPESGDIANLRQLFEAFNQKRDILSLLDQCLNAQKVQIFIGKESGFDVLDNYSLVAAPYSAKGQIVGVLGVIGPTRMPYSHVISVVDVTSKLLTSALNQGK